MVTNATAGFVRVFLAGESRVVPKALAMQAAEEMGAGPKGIPTFEDCNSDGVLTIPAPIAVVSASMHSPTFSEFGEGKQVIDEQAKTRIEAVQAKLIAAGVKVDAGEQLFATGTRMAREGYATQAARKVEHDAKVLFVDAANALADRIKSEQREDVEISARELGNAITVNGKVAAFGLAFSEPAIRGLTGRLESPMLGYVLGLRERIAMEISKPEAERNVAAIQADKAKIADVLRHECMRNGDVALKLRTRKANADVFAVVSPTYSPADAPEVVGQILNDMPNGSKGSWSYDPASTTWELRAEVWTPTPVEMQAVGEPFEGFASFRARDNGTGRFRGGGGVTMLRCLNASTYSANAAHVSRVHVGAVLYDINALMKASMEAIKTLCEAWGENRQEALVAPDGVPIEVAIPGFWRHLLRDRRSELVGVLPGRSERHVEGLTKAFHAERRDQAGLVRSDLAQGFTRYIQSQPTVIRREAESAIGEWLVSKRPVGCDLRESV